jgi:Na+/melibiose symporter-like transporter
MEKVHCERKKQKISSLFRESINTFKNTHFRKVVFGYLMANISGALVTTLGLHVYTYTFGMDNKQTSITMAMIFVMAVVGQPFWIFIAEKQTRRHR